MKWFEGSIPEAIQTAKANGAVFIVYISGDDDLSKQMEEVWQDAAICDLCEKERCVGLSLNKDSDGCKQFGEIYPIICVPCTFFISNTGVPLEVVGGHLEKRDFYKKIQNAVQMHKAMLGSTTPDDGAAENQPPPAETSQSKPAATTPTDAQPTAGICEPVIPSDTQSTDDTPTQINSADTATQNVSADTQTTKPAEPALSVEDRVQRAREVLEEKRRQKAEEEKEKQKEKEKERRQLGANMSRFKRMQSDMEAEEIKQARLKEKQEERAARERVRKQIAADKADRIARNQKEREERQQQNTAATAPPASVPLDPSRMEYTRLQFRLPDGSAVTERFASSDTLATARSVISPHVASLGGRYSLSTTYPKRVFTEDDMSETLLALNLAPSAVIIVLPSSMGTAPIAHTDSIFSPKFLWMVLSYPFITIWGFLYNFFFTPPQPHRRRHRPQPTPAPNAGPSSSDHSAQSAPDRPSTSSARNRPKSSYGLRKRQEGNIHRLSADDSDDDQTTWNGNSTQQM